MRQSLILQLFAASLTFLEHRIMTLNLARQFSKAILVPLQLIGKQCILCGKVLQCAFCFCKVERTGFAVARARLDLRRKSRNRNIEAV